MTAVVAAGVLVTRWWLAHHGTLLAAGFGLGVGPLGALGGPVARTAVAVLAATDSLGDGADRLSRL